MLLHIAVHRSFEWFAGAFVGAERGQWSDIVVAIPPGGVKGGSHISVFFCGASFPGGDFFSLFSGKKEMLCDACHNCYGFCANATSCVYPATASEPHGSIAIIALYPWGGRYGFHNRSVSYTHLKL